MQFLSAAITAVVFFAGGAVGGWYLLVAQSDGPKGFFDPNNVEILLICGLIPGILGAILGFFAHSIFVRPKESEY